MADAYKRHDISDAAWKRLEPCLPGRKGTWGGNARDNRQFINAVFWILRTGAPWRDLPPSYGDWKNTHRRFCRWRDKGVWESLLEKLIDEPEFEFLMIDASHVKVHAHGTGALGGNEDMAKTKGGSIPKYGLKSHDDIIYSFFHQTRIDNWSGANVAMFMAHHNRTTVAFGDGHGAVQAGEEMYATAYFLKCWAILPNAAGVVTK